MRIVTVGSAMIDSIAIIDDDRIERMSMRNSDVSYLLLEQGRKIEAKEISQHFGGGGVNAAVCLARLGYDAACIAKVGDDDRAGKIVAHLLGERVDARGVSRDPRDATGASILIGAHDRDISIFTYRGANTLLSAADFSVDLLRADLVYVGALSNEAADAFPHIVALAKEAGAKIATNPGVRQLGRRGGDFFEALDKIDILSMNRIEAATLLPRIVDRFGEGGPALPVPLDVEAPPLARTGFSASGFDVSLAKYVGAMLEMGVGALLITDGARGAYAAGAGKIRYRPAQTVEVVATVGAGDAFAATFCAWLTETGDIGAALDAAAINAASVVGQINAQTGLLGRAELEARMAALDGDRADALEWSVEK